MSVEAVVVAVLAAALVWYYLNQKERQRRLEIVHKERLTAMEKGIPLPEFPDPALKAEFRVESGGFPAFPGIVLTAFGGGAMIALAMLPSENDAQAFWPLPLPILLMGLGMLLYSFLTADRTR